MPTIMHYNYIVNINPEDSVVEVWNVIMDDVVADVTITGTGEVDSLPV